MSRTLIALFVLQSALGLDAQPSVPSPGDIPPDFDWRANFYELEGSEQVDEGAENRLDLPDFPPVVDVSLQGDCLELPEMFPLDFLFEKIAERFNMDVPSAWTEPGKPIPVDDTGLTGDIEKDLGTGPNAGRRLRGLQFTGEKNPPKPNGALPNHDGKPKELFSTCPVCKNARRWRRCYKNSCARSGRRRSLQQQQEYDDVEIGSRELSNGPTKDAREAAQALREAAAEMRQIAEEYASKGDPRVGDLLKNKAALLDESSDMLAEKAYGLESMEDGLELKWSQVVDKLEKAEEQIKSVGKMEANLNIVAHWFSKTFGCPMGVVVTRLE